MGPLLFLAGRREAKAFNRKGRKEMPLRSQRRDSSAWSSLRLEAFVRGRLAQGESCLEFRNRPFSDTLTNDHAQDTVFPLFLSDDVLRLDSCGYREPRPEPAQIRV